MPLQVSTSRPAFESNLKAELGAGKPQDQALAIAYAEKRKAGGHDKLKNALGSKLKTTGRTR